MTAPTLALAALFPRPSHGISLVITGTISASRRGAVAPRRGRQACNWSTARSHGGPRPVSRISCSSAVVGDDKAAPTHLTLPTPNDCVKMKATVTLKHTDPDPSTREVLGLELVSSDLDSQTGNEKTPIPGSAIYWGTDHVPGNVFSCEATFSVPASFGPIGAVLVENKYDMEMFLMDMVVAAVDDSASVTFEGNSWIDPKSAGTGKHVFFPLKSYLPSDTPRGVENLRESELKAIRGDGSGKRNKLDRIYDYDVYNDLGNPDEDDALARPVLGGSNEYPYPRRCRTGRPRGDTDNVYVPKDEVFSPSDKSHFSRNLSVSSVPAVRTIYDTSEMKSLSFPSFTAIDSLFLDDTAMEQPPSSLSSMILKGLKYLFNTSDRLEQNFHAAMKALKFEVPQLMASDRFAWLTDEEFARQTLSGVNPLSIQLVTEFPFVSKLDEKEYGPRESGITKELIEKQIGLAMTVEEAVAKKKLFMLDYHDLLLPFVNDVRELEGTTLYGSRTVFFLTEEGTLRPIAIELTRPKGKPPSILVEPWSQVFTPRQSDGTGSWLWILAKAHVLAHDSGYHQLVNHWLRTHCCVEPYIIAANRQLSRMHPIYRLLRPHFRYTMQINAVSRDKLISADGIIERTFSPGRYSMELSSAAYKDLWQFDLEALPADLVRRGMAVQEEDGTLTLTIEDYRIPI